MSLRSASGLSCAFTFSEHAEEHAGSGTATGYGLNRPAVPPARIPPPRRAPHHQAIQTRRGCRWGTQRNHSLSPALTPPCPQFGSGLGFIAGGKMGWSSSCPHVCARSKAAAHEGASHKQTQPALADPAPSWAPPGPCPEAVCITGDLSHAAGCGACLRVHSTQPLVCPKLPVTLTPTSPNPAL